jgi:hypothetical protein
VAGAVGVLRWHVGYNFVHGLQAAQLLREHLPGHGLAHPATQRQEHHHENEQPDTHAKTHGAMINRRTTARVAIS